MGYVTDIKSLMNVAGGRVVQMEMGDFFCSENEVNL